MFKKFLISLIAVVPCLFINDVKALSTDKGEFPDVPEGYKTPVIVKDGSNYILYAAEEEAEWNQIDVVMYESTDNTDIYASYSTDLETYQGSYSYNIFDLSGDNWVPQVGISTNQVNLSSDELIYTSLPFYSYDKTIAYNAGYGTVISGLFESASSTISNTMVALGTITSALISNTIFQIMIGLIILGLVISLVSYFTRKLKNRGR